jgi:hypothetical protein
MERAFAMGKGGLSEDLDPQPCRLIFKKELKIRLKSVK